MTFTRVLAGLLLSAVACAGDAARDVDTTSAKQSNGAAAWVVGPDSFGPIPLGAPATDVAAVLGDSITPGFKYSELCDHVVPHGLPAGTRLMVLRDSVRGPLMVERVGVDTAGILTAEGVGVGDPEVRVVELYRGRVSVQPHKYTGPMGHYVVVTSPRDSMYRIIFETDGQQVLRYRAGRRPAVDFIEGCS